MPLSDNEATWALQALQIARPETGAALALGPQPAYVFLTGILFGLFNPNNFLARFWPAILGALTILTPYFFRRDLGKKAALLMAFGLALDPGLVAVSRQAGGPMMALGLALLALGAWRMHKPIQTGIFVGLALLSGPAILPGVFIVLLAWFAARRTGQINQGQMIGFENQNEWRQALLFGLAAFLAVGTLFLRYPQGLSAWANTLTEYLAGLSQGTGISFLKMLVTSLIYQPLAWIFALIGIGRWIFYRLVQKRVVSGLFIVLALSALFALIVIGVYPARATSDLIWFTIPLWAMAATELNHWLSLRETPVISVVQAGLFVILSGMFWNTLISTHQIAPQAGESLALLQAMVLTGILALGGLTAILIAYGWSWPASRSGMVLGVIAASLIYSTATLWSATQIRPNNPVEFWSPQNTTANTDLLLSTLQDLSIWETGMPEQVELAITVDTPSIRWFLRDFRQASFVANVPATQLPPVMITPLEQETPALSAAYRGQDFPWIISPGWAGALPDDFISWLTFRQAPLQKEMIILWARADLFPGYTLPPITSSP